MAVLLLAEVNDGELFLDATSKAVTAAIQLGDVTVLCAGGSAADAASEAAKNLGRGQGALCRRPCPGASVGGIHS